jgi:hypothetical protein
MKKSIRGNATKIEQAGCLPARESGAAYFVETGGQARDRLPRLFTAATSDELKGERP